MTGVDWWEQAACRGKPVHWWFPEPTGSVTHARGGHDPRYDQARNICRGCPAHDQCAAWALEQQIPDGMFAGLTPYQRSRTPQHRRSRKRVANTAQPALFDPAANPTTPAARRDVAEAWIRHIRQQLAATR